MVESYIITELDTFYEKESQISSTIITAHVVHVVPKECMQVTFIIMHYGATAVNPNDLLKPLCFKHK